MSESTSPKTVLIVSNPDHPIGPRLSHGLESFSRSTGSTLDVLMWSVGSEEHGTPMSDAIWSHYIGEHSNRPDLIINAHELGDLNQCETNPESAFTRNSMNPTRLALAARAAGIPMIQFSTDLVFGGGVRGPYADHQQPNPTNTYGLSKLAGENAARSIHPFSNDGALNGTIIVRIPSLLYGKGTGGIGENIYHVIASERTLPSMSMPHGGKGHPSFVGDITFLLVRNLVVDYAAFNKPVIHIGPTDNPISTWYQYFTDRGVTNIKAPVQGKWATKSPYPSAVGLIPSAHWHIAKDPSVQWKNSLAEYQTEDFMVYT